MRLPIQQGYKLIAYAKRQEDREYLFRHYLTVFPYMDKKNMKPFDEYFNELVRMAELKLDTRSTDEIMEEILQIKI